MRTDFFTKKSALEFGLGKLGFRDPKIRQDKINELLKSNPRTTYVAGKTNTELETFVLEDRKGKTHKLGLSAISGEEVADYKFSPDEDLVCYNIWFIYPSMGVATRA